MSLNIRLIVSSEHEPAGISLHQTNDFLTILKDRGVPPRWSEQRAQ